MVIERFIHCSQRSEWVQYVHASIVSNVGHLMILSHKAIYNPNFVIYIGCLNSLNQLSSNLCSLTSDTVDLSKTKT